MTHCRASRDTPQVLASVSSLGQALVPRYPGCRDVTGWRAVPQVMPITRIHVKRHEYNQSTVCGVDYWGLVQRSSSEFTEYR
jgi:hypothetical protein